VAPPDLFAAHAPSGLVLVCAPARHGKTALLADWAERRPPRKAWLSLDSGDNDPARFWLTEAERAFTDAIAGRQAAGLPTWRAWASYQLGRVQQAQGRLDAVARTCEEALEAAATGGHAPLPAAGPAQGAANRTEAVARARQLGLIP
jgi:hypothetical protein